MIPEASETTTVRVVKIEAAVGQREPDRIEEPEQAGGEPQAEKQPDSDASMPDHERLEDHGDVAPGGGTHRASAAWRTRGCAGRS